MIGLGDNIGSGFPAILDAWKKENWRKPDLSQNEELHQVELKLWMASLMPEECLEYLSKLFGIKYSHLTREEMIILGTAYLENGVTNTRMQSILDLHSIEIGHILSELVAKNMLINHPKGRWTSYYINHAYEIQEEQIELSDLSYKQIQFKNKSDQIIYDYIQTNGFITTHQILNITSITTQAGVSAAVRRMMRDGLIQKVRQGRHFIYQLNG